MISHELGLLRDGYVVEEVDGNSVSVTVSGVLGGRTSRLMKKRDLEKTGIAAVVSELHSASGSET